MMHKCNIFSKIQSYLEKSSNRINDSRPYVTLSYAQSIDGSIAYRPGRPLALSCNESLEFTHCLRSAHDAILVGIGTILADNPSLTVRYIEGKSPQPVIVDGRLRFPLNAQALLNSHHLPWIATAENSDIEREQTLLKSGATVIRIPAHSDGLINLKTLLHRLINMNITSIMVEGGAEIITSFLKEQLVDQIVLTVSPVYVGGLHAIGPFQLSFLNPPVLQNTEWERCGTDLILRADIVWDKK
ncbi:MAG: dihydrofolate reductase family protein [Smithella sp.]